MAPDAAATAIGMDPEMLVDNSVRDDTKSLKASAAQREAGGAWCREIDDSPTTINGTESAEKLEAGGGGGSSSQASSGGGDDPAVALGEAALTFKDVSFSTAARRGKAAKTILEPVSGHFEPGTLAAIMGPSGSGKTTLMDILAAKKTAPYSGMVHLNGRPRDKLFLRMCAYVPQHDIMPAYLTVKEAVLFHASLKEEWPSGFRGEKASQHTDKQLKTLGLYEVRDSRIGDENIRGISGGQKRRLSLARGLASGARLLFCDEPTSGLSATDAESCVQYMRMICDHFRATVIVVIHQPRVEVAELFDHLLLLTSKPGRAVYNGPMSGADKHFEQATGRPMPARVNPIDYCMDLVTPEHQRGCPDVCVEYYNKMCRPMVAALVDRELANTRSTPLELLGLWRRSMEEFGTLPPLRNSKYGVRFRRQLLIVFRRQLLLNLRDKQGILVDLIVAVAKAVVIGVAYLRIGELSAQYQIGFFFMVLMSCAVEPMKNMPKIIADRTIMKHEVADCLYTEWAYLISFTFINWVQMLLTNGLYVTILFWMSGLNWDMFGELFLWTTLVTFTMDSLFVMIAAIATDTSVAFILSLPFLMIFLLYNGFTTTTTTVPSFMKWAVHISPVAHAMEAVIVAASKAQPDDSLYPMILETFGYEDDVASGLEVMLISLLVFRLVQIVCLKKLNNIQR